jgi:hypothetical protein
LRWGGGVNRALAVGAVEDLRAVFDLEQRDEKKAQVVVGALGERLILPVHGASFQRLIEALGFGLYAGYEKHLMRYP